MCANPKNDEETISIAASDVITELNGYDVLLGRSIPKWKCSGNGIFRKLIANHGDEYRSLNKHVHKDEIARRILLTIRALGGRFLRQIELLSVKERLNIDGDTEAWVAVDEETSLQKIKQALRDLPYNAKSPSVPASMRQNLEASPKSRYSSSGIIPSNEMLFNRVDRNVSRLPFRKRQTTKLDDILAYRNKEYLRVHNLTISTQLRLLKQHQGQMIDHISGRRRYHLPLRGKLVPRDAKKLAAVTGSGRSNIFVR